MFICIPFHEPWGDEIQAFLIARAAGWKELLCHIPNAEGQPVLWHILLKILIYFYDSPNVLFVSAVIMAAAVWLILFKYDISPVYKILLPFGHYFLYQYSIVGRNYCLAYLALVLTGLFYRERHRKIRSYALSLLFLAETTTFYAPVAAVLGLIWFGEGYRLTNGKPKQYIASMCMLAAFGLFFLWQVMPISHFSFNGSLPAIHNRHMTTESYPLYIATQIATSLFSFPFFISFYLLFIMPSLLKAPQRILAASTYKTGLTGTGAACCAAFFIIYWLVLPNIYHQGLVWGMFLFICYISASEKNLRTARPFFILLMVLQICRGLFAVYIDINYPFSAQQQTAEIIKKHAAPDADIALATWGTLPLRLLFPPERFSISSSDTLYIDNNNIQQKDYQKKVNLHRDVLVFDKANKSFYKNIDLSYYEKSGLFYLYTAEGIMPFPQHSSFWNMTNYIYIRKTKHIP